MPKAALDLIKGHYPSARQEQKGGGGCIGVLWPGLLSTHIQSGRRCRVGSRSRNRRRHHGQARISLAPFPHLVLVRDADGGHFEGAKEITGTTVSLTDLGMPVPSRFRYVSGDGQYTAQMTGVITSELVPGFLVNSRIRAHGKLDLRDSEGHTGVPKLARSGEVELAIEDSAGTRLSRQVWVAP